MKKISHLILVLIAISFTSYGQSGQNSRNLNLSSSHLALEGFDPVAYFKEKKAVKGSSSISVENDGARYQFATEANKKLFIESPGSYKPQYGGWCAYAMGANGEKVEVDPETFKIIDGKLYLFYNSLFNNTLNTWNKDEPHLKVNADKNWVKLTNK